MISADEIKLASQVLAWLGNARTLNHRLHNRSRSETFYPGSVAPELLRRAQEAFDEGLDDIGRLAVLVEDTVNLVWPDDVLERVERWVNAKGGDADVREIAQALIAAANPRNGGRA